MKYFMCKLIPPRPTFSQDMTEAEKKVMQEHVSYCNNLTNKGTAIVVGPVFDPKGVWGLAVVEVNDEAEVHSLEMNDPVIKNSLGFRYEIYSMPQAILRR